MLQAWPRQALIGLVHGYRFLLKPWLGNVCRFEPSCSAYALTALLQHGAAAGAYLATRRILRCHPWCDGGCDPVPDTAPRLFTRKSGLSDCAAAGRAKPATARPARMERRII